MTVRVAALALVTALLLLGSARAPVRAGNWLTNVEIELAIKGHTLEGVYATGRRFTERYLENGRLEYSEDGLTMAGSWSATAGTLCTIYDTDTSGGCFRVERTGKNCFEFYFVSRSEAAVPQPENQKPDWTARGTLDGSLEGCPEFSNV